MTPERKRESYDDVGAVEERYLAVPLDEAKALEASGKGSIMARLDAERCIVSTSARIAEAGTSAEELSEQEVRRVTGPMPAKRFYRVKAITDEGGTRPDIPEGINWVGNTDGETYVVVTHHDVEIPGAEELSFEEASRALGSLTNLPGDDAGEKWGVG